MDQNFGPTWFKNTFPSDSSQATALSNAMWREFLTPTVFSLRIKTGSKGYGFMNYQPKLVAQQFGLSQILPKSLVYHSIDIVWVGLQLIFKGHKAYLKFYTLNQHLDSPVFKFHQSFLTTKDFDKWWSEYQRKYSPSSLFLQNLIEAFSALAGETPASQPNIDALVENIQTTDVDEDQPKMVTTAPLTFLSLRRKTH